MSKLQLGFSPCPNDTFIFDAIVNQKIDTQGLEFEICLADVEELNQKAKRNELDITKLSYHALSKFTNNYNLLSAGSALGNNCGPLLICKNEFPIEELSKKTIAIPGETTTANFLLQFFSKPNKTVVYLFSEIEEAIENNDVDAGVIIHENRFTYKEKGLQLIQDLGDYWEQQTGFPIPLGGIAIKRELPIELRKNINQLIRKSIEFAFANTAQLPEYVVKHAQEMEEEVIRKHINLYVNKYSLNLGAQGKKAVKFMMSQLGNHNLTIIE